MKKTAIFGILTLMIVGIVFASGIVDAYKGDYSVEGPNYSRDRHELMENAFDTLDYNAWYELMTENDRNPRVVDIVTEDNFEIFVQAHEAGRDGDFETATKLRAELGLNNGHGQREGNGFGKRMRQEECQRIQHKIGK